MFGFSIAATIGGVLVVIGLSTALLTMYRIARAERQARRDRGLSR
jgi:uncharacterized membrane protein YidH (DUF202 family)